VIRLKGNLEFNSSNSQIRLYQKDGEAICAINGWPHPFSPQKLSQIKLPESIEHEKVKILYNNRHVGYLENGRFKLTGYLVGIMAYFDYLKSIF